MRLGGARLFDPIDRDRVPHLAGAGEVLRAKLPRDAQRAQDLALGRLPAGAPLFDRVNRARRYTGLVGELVLGPAQRLSGGSDPVHGAVAGSVSAFVGRAIRMVAPEVVRHPIELDPPRFPDRTARAF